MTGRTMLRTLTAVMLPAVVLLVVVPAVVKAQAPVIGSATPLDELKGYAAKSNPDAMLELGERLVQGTGVTTDVRGGLAWLQRAADAGKTEAWYSLGFVYSNGIGVTTDPIHAMDYFRKGAAVGDANCQTSLGMYYQAGERIKGGVKADPVEAVKWYRMAAEQNHTEAIQHLAQLCFGGQGLERNAEEAARWFRRGALLGSPECMWGLGQCYQHGMGVAMDTVEAYALFAAAAAGAENPEMKKGMTEQAEKIRKGLNTGQLAKADASTEEWKAKRK